MKCPKCGEYLKQIYDWNRLPEERFYYCKNGCYGIPPHHAIGNLKLWECVVDNTKEESVLDIRKKLEDRLQKVNGCLQRLEECRDIIPKEAYDERLIKYTTEKNEIEKLLA